MSKSSLKGAVLAKACSGKILPSGFWTELVQALEISFLEMSRFGEVVHL